MHIQNFQFAFSKFCPLIPIIKKYILAFEKNIVYYFYEEDLTPIKAKIRISVEEAKIADLPKIVNIRTKHGRRFNEGFLKRDKYLMKTLERIKRNHRCFIGIKDNEIIGYIWFAIADFFAEEIKRRILLRKDEGILYDWYVSPSQRGKGVGLEILSRVIILLRKEGYQRIFILTRSYNTPSRKAIEKIKGKVKTQITFVKILNFNKLIIPPNSGILHLRDDGIIF